MLSELLLVKKTSQPNKKTRKEKLRHIKTER